MLWAQLKGKLRVRDERSEDLLTSNVFGVLKYVPFSHGLAPVLRTAIGPGAERLEPFLTSATTATVEFWPWFESSRDNGCEPDVVLRLFSASGEKAVVFIEAKYMSGKSSNADTVPQPGEPRDQLAREWKNCCDSASALHAEPILLFLTLDHVFPTKEVHASHADLESCGLDTGTILWTSWQRITAALQDEHEILRDLRKLLVERYGFAFDGFEMPRSRLQWNLVDGTSADPFTAALSHRLLWLLRQPHEQWTTWSWHPLNWKVES